MEKIKGRGEGESMATINGQEKKEESEKTKHA